MSHRPQSLSLELILAKRYVNGRTRTISSHRARRHLSCIMMDGGAENTRGERVKSTTALPRSFTVATRLTIARISRLR